MNAPDPMNTPARAGARAVWDDELERRRCTATAKGTGVRCLNRPIKGSNVCRNHGGSAPQVRKAARIRLAELVDPAIVTLARAMTEADADWATKVRSAEAVLDRAGYPRRTTINVDDARERLAARIAQLRADREAAE